MARKRKSSAKSRAQVSSSARQRPVHTGLFAVCIGVVAICVASILFLVIANVPVERFGVGPRWFILGLLALFFLASLAWEEVIPPLNRQSLEKWRRPKVLGGIVYLLLGATGFIAGIANVFDPPASQAKLNEVGVAVETIGNDTTALVEGQSRLGEAIGIGAPSLVRRHIAGIWGEPGCRITYRLVLNDRSLVMQSLRDEPGMSPFREEYSWIADENRPGASGERLSIAETREVGGAHDGQSVTFTYGGNGTSAWLEWKHRNKDINAQRFIRCDVGEQR